MGTDMDVMDYLVSHPEQAAATFEVMSHQQLRGKTWMDGSVPTEEFKLSEAEVEEGRALIVDVGGGGAHQCSAFREAFPERKGRMVVQDLEVMIGLIDQQLAASIGLEPMIADFFSAQPVEGAKVYYLRNMLHDWNDEKSEVILSSLRKAMAADSVVVLDEMLIPAQGATEGQMMFDVTMMACVGAMERSEKQRRRLGESTGLRLRDISV